MDEGEATTTRYDAQREVRLAVVLYGGVSLAIYMYGVAEELHRLVRATAPDVARDAVRFGEPTSTEHVYRELGRIGPAGEMGEAVRTRFVVDIISGTSAGGINGICLAKALANNGSLDKLKDVWIHAGDIKALVNDEESLAGTGLDPEIPPNSLLSGDLMSQQIVAALGSTNAPAGKDDRELVDEIDLWVTTTDLEGVTVKLPITGQGADEKRFATRHHFCHPAKRGALHLTQDHDRLLAHAARATSAFPFAFKPAVIEDLRQRFPDGWGDSIDDLRRSHPEYSEASPDLQLRSFSDGGILDNKPFSQATDSLVGRRADLPVVRKLIYVEPDPVRLEPTGRTLWKPHQTVQAALLGIPRYEGVHDDIEAVLARNDYIIRAREVLAALPSETPAPPAAALIADPEEWKATTLSDRAQSPQWGPTYLPYHRLKVASVVDWLAEVVTDAGPARGLREDRVRATRKWIEAWRSDSFSPDAADKEKTDSYFLLRFDLPYRTRRIDFVLQWVKQMDGVPRALRSGLSEARAILGGVDDTVVETIEPHLLPIAEGASDTGGQAQALESLFDAISRAVHFASDAARAGFELAIAGHAHAVELQRIWDRYETYDLTLFPLTYGTPIAETNPVDIVRISPDDADGPDLGLPKRPPLRGHSFGHFGAFLEESWRRSDMLWGRLDAAECLLETIGGKNEQTRQLIKVAHTTIIGDFARDVVPEREAEVRSSYEAACKWLQGFPVAASAESAAPAVGRSQAVIAKIGAAAAGAKGRAVAEPALEALLAGGKPATATWALLDALVGKPWVRKLLLGLWLAIVALLVIVAIFVADDWGRAAAMFGVGLLGAAPAGLWLLVTFGVGEGAAAIRERVQKILKDPPG